MIRICLLILLAVLMYPIQAYASSSITIVDHSRPHATIRVPVDASEQLKAAARNMQEYVAASTSAELPIMVFQVNEEVQARQARIWLGFRQMAENLDLHLEKMDDDGFVIAFPSDADILICGPTDWGTRFGVYHFLEHFLGISWLMPGPDGEHIPRLKTVAVDKKEIRGNPAFIQRNLGGLKNPAQREWADRNGLHKVSSYGHNLFRIIDPEVYAKARPDFFPLINGRRHVPKKGGKHKWQPCFTADGLVEASVESINAYFDTHPDKTFFSLGMNHGHLWCECQQCQALDTGNTNYLGFKDHSNSYFTWANEVVQGVLQRHPDKWFGMLAHQSLAEAPTRVPVHPRIVPFITYDFMKWVDAELAQTSKRVILQWAAVSKRLGWYDYLYGTPYCLPRVYFHHMADCYRFCHANKVRYMAAETFPNWGEAPKYYLALRLQWDPQQNVDTLLDEWYRSCVGEVAAPFLKAYFEKWESFWTKRGPNSKWFSRKGNYLPFKETGYLSLVTHEDMIESRHLLEKTVEKANTQKQSARARLLLRAFEYYEATALSYLGIVMKQPLPDKLPDYYQAQNKKRFDLVKAFDDHPILVHPIRFDLKDFKGFKW